MSTVVRKQAPRPARPVGRYWRGKAPKDAAEVASESEEDVGEGEEGEEDEDVLIGDIKKEEGDDDDDEAPAQRGPKAQVTTKINIAIKDVDISEEGKVIVAGRQESGRTRMEGMLLFELASRLMNFYILRRPRGRGGRGRGRRVCETGPGVRGSGMTFRQLHTLN